MANENGWGLGRLMGELKKLGLTICKGTVRNILLENGFEGWCTVEQDCDPTLPDTDPLRDAKINRAYLNSIGFD